MSTDYTAEDFLKEVDTAVTQSGQSGGVRGVSKAIVPDPGQPPHEDSPLWKEVGQLERISIFPIKSCMGIELEEAEVTKESLRSGSFLRDRQFLIAERIREAGEQDKFRVLVGRHHASLVMIQLSLETGDDNNVSVILAVPGMEDFTLKIGEDKEQQQLDIYGELVKGIDLGDEVSAWLSEYLFDAGSSRVARLMFHRQGKLTREEHKRRRDGSDGDFPAVRKGDVPIYADFTPYSLMSMETVQEVEREVRAANPTLDDRIEFDHRRYRQNLMVRGAPRPFDEDSYAFVRVGESVILRTVCLTPRCQMTAVDPDLGIRDSGEPLKTLMTFRTAVDPNERRGLFSLPVLGLMLAQVKGGIIRTGDKIMAVKRADWNEEK